MQTHGNNHCNETFLVRLTTAVRRAKSSIFSQLRKTCSDGDDRTDSGKLFETDAAVGGNVRSPEVERDQRP